MITCRPIRESEAALAAALEAACLETAWTETQILESLSGENTVYLGAFAGEKLCGILSAYCVAGDGEIMNLAVLPEFRRRGVAKALLNGAFAELERRNCQIITLEVAEDNESAIALYLKLGFTKIGTRKNFYKGKNAYIMQINSN